jgi:hypothetical protein
MTGVAGVLLLVLAAQARTTARLVGAQADSRTKVWPDQRGIADLVRRYAGESPVLLEGLDAGYPANDYFDAPALIDAVGATGARESFDPARSINLYGNGYAQRTPDPSYQPSYGLVVTRFGGVDTGRRKVGSAGPFAVLRRAPIDVGIFRTGWALDQGRGETAVPWILGPFELWISAPQRPPSVAVTLGLRGPDAASTAVSATVVSGAPLPLVRDTTSTESTVCMVVPIAGSLTRVLISTAFDPPMPPYGGLFPDVRPPPVPKRLALERARARVRDSCGRRLPKRSGVHRAAGGNPVTAARRPGHP